jgi:hypothetical protein
MFWPSCKWLDSPFRGRYYERRPVIFRFKEFIGMKLLRRIFSDENLAAVLAFLIFVAILLMTANTSPLWIYQGF